MSEENKFLMPNEPQKFLAEDLNNILSFSFISKVT